MNQDQKILREKLLALGLPPSTCRRYIKGDWTIPDSIKKLIEENEIKE